jgi:hypothetical protein
VVVSLLQASAGYAEGARFGVDCSGNRLAQASILVPTLRDGDIVFMDEIAQPGGLQEACS